MYKYLKRIADFVIVLVTLVVPCDFSVYKRKMNKRISVIIKRNDYIHQAI